MSKTCRLARSAKSNHRRASVQNTFAHEQPNTTAKPRPQGSWDLEERGGTRLFGRNGTWGGAADHVGNQPAYAPRTARPSLEEALTPLSVGQGPEAARTVLEPSQPCCHAALATPGDRVEYGAYHESPPHDGTMRTVKLPQERSPTGLAILLYGGRRPEDDPPVVSKLHRVPAT